MEARRHPVSIICVFNNPEVRRDCLDASIELLHASAPDVEYLPVDNTGRQFSTAGAALNHGASLARHDYLVFVHQDVFLHSLIALEEAAGVLAEGEIGLLGAAGIRGDGQIAGFVRDRVELLGSPLASPEDVDSLDEVLFMTTRSLMLSEPLTEQPEMAWHAYAVEYGLRVKALGLRVAAANIPLTHNSLTVNLDRLDVAHRAVGDLYPDDLPVRTTCGVIEKATAAKRKPVLASHRWRYRWLKGSVTAHAARRAMGGGAFVLADIRLDVDDVIASSKGTFGIFNLDATGLFVEALSDGLLLHRRGYPVEFRSGRLTQLTGYLRSSGSSGTILLTNLDTGSLPAIVDELGAREHISGLHDDLGVWMLLEPPASGLPAVWRTKPAIPLGMSALAG